ncbi:hypothetical protein GQ55_5G073300 [Panicum hallii var. hallii]|uniref:Uncharacterized protein n=1 Tax=Panicum hallii var. hallii TaxID=1504633 RepID=A0A2T7DDU9_9POAL|nr:hypothetical protein GQ55_5G073300 [Panicum hallii var. hallii]
MHEISMVPVSASSRVFVLRSVFPSCLSHALGSQSLPAETCSQRTQAPVASQGRPEQRTRMITAHAMAWRQGAAASSRARGPDRPGGKFPCPGPCPVSSLNPTPRFLGALVCR